MELQTYSSIGQYRHVVEKVRRRAEYVGRNAADEPLYDIQRVKPTIAFQGTVKLHGTNAGIDFDLNEGTFRAKSRERYLTVEEDNHGFCAWMESPAGQSELNSLLLVLRQQTIHANLAGFTGICRVYGEWCGNRVNGKTGIGTLPNRWVVFGVSLDVVETLNPFDSKGVWWNLEPISKAMQRISLTQADRKLFFISDYPTFTLSIDFNEPERALDRLEELTRAVEANCPVAQAMGSQGIGEGIVWVSDTPEYGHLAFKTKGMKHKGTKNARLVQVAPEVMESLDGFAAAVLTESRLEQGYDLIRAHHGKVTEDHIGTFLKWVGQDVLKEESDTLEASGLERKQVMGRINNSAKLWLLPRLARC